MKKQILIICALVLGIMTANAKDGETVKKETNLITQKTENQKHSSYLFTIDFNPKDTKTSCFNPLSSLCQEIKGTLRQNNFPDTSGVVGELDLKLDSFIKWSFFVDSIYRKLTFEKEVDIIGQVHNGSYFDQSSEIQNLQSQSMIKDLILSSNYPVIGIEGFSGNIWDKDISIAENFKKSSRLRDGFVKSFTVLDINNISSKTMLDFESKNAFYAMINSGFFPINTQVIGCEDSTVHYFNGITMQLGGLEQNNSYYKINNLVLKLRSYISFYKMVNYLITKEKQKGAIIIGAAHMKDFTILARYFGVKTNFYNTSSMYLNDWSIFQPQVTITY